MEVIYFDAEDGEQMPFFVIEETTINEIRYLLVSGTDPEDMTEEESDATILKCVGTDDEEAVYEFVQDDAEWDAVLSVFAELTEDFELEQAQD